MTVSAHRTGGTPLVLYFRTMKILTTLICLLSLQSLMAQPASQEAVELQRATLEERFLIMKNKSQKYGDYKVIKEAVLDGVWRITRDSMRTQKALVKEKQDAIASLQSQLQNAQATLQQKEASMAELVNSSTHISVLGINLEKKTFVGVFFTLLIGLVLALVVMTGKLKSMYSAIKEKIDLVNATNFEFEEYKHKALDKQTKLSRELQNERNKLMEMKRG
jgi:hypothetical protein